MIVDDFELIYNGTATGISVKGKAIENFTPETSDYTVNLEGTDQITDGDIVVTTDAKDAKVFVDITYPDNAADATVANITVMSDDLKKTSTYTLTMTNSGVGDGISNISTENDSVEGIYNLNGQRVDTPVNGQVYITKYTNGKTVKTIKK